jgi:hypothetical protein
MRKRLSYANVMATLAFLIAVAGGTAYAANTIGSTDIINGQVKSVDIGTGQVLSGDVKNEGLTGSDIADQSGVDTCTHGTIRIGELCVHNTDSNSQWLSAHQLCESMELRVPTLGEALVAANHTIPNLETDERFWTEEFYTAAGTGTGFFALAVMGLGSAIEVSSTNTAEVVCVTTPTN